MQPTGTVDSILKVKGHDVWSVSPDTLVFDAIKVMADRNVGALMVMEGERLVGVFSERDYTRKVALMGKSSKQILVREIITGRLITVSLNTSVQECMHLMVDHRIRHLPVVDEGRVVGIVSIGDLVNWIIHAQSATIDQLQSYITGSLPG